MKKARIIIGLILNLLILGGVGFAVANAYFGFWGPGLGYGVNLFLLFAVDANLLLGLAALLMLIVDFAMLAGKKSCRFVQAIKLIAVIPALLAAGYTIAYLYPVQNAPLEYFYNVEHNLFLYAIVPALGLLSFIVENEPRMKAWKYAFLGIIGPVVFGGVIALLFNLQVINGLPYDFPQEVFIYDTNKIWVTIVWAAGTVVVSYLLAFLILLLHNIGAGKAKVEEKPEPAKEEPVAAEEVEALPPVNKAEEEPEVLPEEPVAVEQPEEKPEPVTVLAPKTAYAHRKLRAKPNVRTYHVTKQPSGQWQVKLAGSNKAIKLFPTQREAIAYARGLCESRGGSYRIHSVKGKIRS